MCLYPVQFGFIAINFLMKILYHIIAGQGKHSIQSDQMQIRYGANLVAIMSAYKAARIITPIHC